MMSFLSERHTHYALSLTRERLRFGIVRFAVQVRETSLRTARHISSAHSAPGLAAKAHASANCGARVEAIVESDETVVSCSGTSSVVHDLGENGGFSRKTRGFEKNPKKKKHV